MTAAEKPCQGSLVVLVDEQDIPRGSCAKLAAHQKGGVLHRAFSIFIVGEGGEILIQQRAGSKYHCPGLWSNSCCSHPRPGRELLDEAGLRLDCELGFTTGLSHIGACTYRIPLDNGLTEWEVDHVLVGEFSGRVTPNPEEVAEVKWLGLAELQAELAGNSPVFTPWLHHILPIFAGWFQERKNLLDNTSRQPSRD